MRRYRWTILKREMINREHEIQVSAITQCDNLAHMILEQQSIKEHSPQPEPLAVMRLTYKGQSLKTTYH